MDIKQLEDFKKLVRLTCSLMPKSLDNDLCVFYAERICNLSSSKIVETLLDFATDKVVYDVSVETKAIMYECLFIIYSNFQTTLDAHNLLRALYKKIN